MKTEFPLEIESRQAEKNPLELLDILHTSKWGFFMHWISERGIG